MTRSLSSLAISTAILSAPWLAWSAPTAVPDGPFNVSGGTAFHSPNPVTFNDTQDSYPVRPVITSPPQHGTVVLLANGSFAYEPQPGYTGPDSFSYKLVDNPPPYQMNIDPAQSVVTVEATVRPGNGLNNPTDSDDVTLTGTVEVALTPNNAPFSEAQITAMELTNSSTAQLNFNFFLAIFPAGSITGTINSGDLNITMLEPGPAAPVDGAGNFTQAGNTFQTTGEVDITASGTVASFITPGTQPLDTVAVQDLPQTNVSQSGGTITLSIPLEFADTFESVDGPSMDLEISGTVVATAPALPPGGESAPVEVTFNVTAAPQPPAVVADFYAVVEGGMLAALAGDPTGSETLLAAGAADWRFFDAGAPPAGWQLFLFDDAGWAQGGAPLGFGEPDIVGTTGSAEPTVYFRREFTVANAADSTGLRLRLRRDDGAAVYLNGNETGPQQPRQPRRGAWGPCARHDRRRGRGGVRRRVPRPAEPVVRGAQRRSRRGPPTELTRYHRHGPRAGQ
ncbi:MAG: Ig-like domain-containing protein [Verrucomicrobiales bacterium]